jgi:hypothetical protein
VARQAAFKAAVTVCISSLLPLQAAAEPVEATLAADLSGLEIRRCDQTSPDDCLTRTIPLPRRGDGRIASYFNLSPRARLLELATADRLAALAQDNGSGLLRFRLPEGLRVSAPWPLVERSETGAVYRFTGAPTGWDGRLALGALQQFELQPPGARLRVSVLDADPAPRAGEFRRWLQQGVEAISAISGSFPLDDVQVLVTPVGRSQGEVPWGQVMRGGFPAIHLFVDQTDPFDALLDDWTLFHEMSHLLIPLMNRRDMWLAEGLASYYQTVSRARAGQLGARLAWQKFLGGLNKGIAQADGRVFRDVLAEREWKTIRRVYWTGAAVLFKADIALRERSDNRQSLDRVLADFQRCCLPSQALWSARELLRRFDELAGGDPVFLPLAEHYLQQPGFPDVERDLERLGVSFDEGTGVVLDPSAPLAAVAAAIMAPAGQRRGFSVRPGGSRPDRPSPLRGDALNPGGSRYPEPAGCRPPVSPAA